VLIAENRESPVASGVVKPRAYSGFRTPYMGSLIANLTQSLAAWSRRETAEKLADWMVLPAALSHRVSFRSIKGAVQRWGKQR
jgi:hypothetical protein